MQRVGRRFALVADAGKLATAAELTGWESGAATWAVLRLLADRGHLVREGGRWRVLPSHSRRG